MPDSSFHRHKFSAYPVKDQHCDKYNDRSHNCAQDTYRNADRYDFSVDFGRIVPDHEYPVAVLQIFVYDQLLYSVLILVGIGAGFSAAV